MRLIIDCRKVGIRGYQKKKRSPGIKKRHSEGFKLLLGKIGKIRFSHPLYLKARKALKMEGCEHFSFYQFKKVIKKVINNVLIAFFDTLKDTYGTKKVIFI